MTWHPTRWLAVLLGGQPWLPRFGRQIVGLDQLLRRLTRGFAVTLLTFAGLPQVFLTVAGRRSGVARTTPLLCVPDRGSWLVAGTNWGGPKPPMWVANLRAADTAVVEFKARDTTVRADELTGADRDEACGDAGHLAELRQVRRAHRSRHPGVPADARALTRSTRDVIRTLTCHRTRDVRGGQAGRACSTASSSSGESCCSQVHPVMDLA